MDNPYEVPSTGYKAPESDLSLENQEWVYVGFWARVLASLVDTVLLLVVIYPLLFLLYGQAYFTDSRMAFGVWDLVLNYVFPAIAVIVFWVYKSATPGKMMLNASIIDARTGAKPSKGQLIGRYFAYYVSLIGLGLGFFWVAWDAQKQGWHDKLAKTVVVRPLRRA